MKSPVGETRNWHELDEAASTQDVAASFLAEQADGAPVGAILALEQTAGRGRYGREWLSKKGDSLTASFIFYDYPDHPQPHLIGMLVAVAAAAQIHCQLQWPNDLMLRNRKVGGLLTEIKKDAAGRSIAVVGLGINLNQTSFAPSIEDRAISLYQATGELTEPRVLAHRIVEHLPRLPEPESWRSIAGCWRLFDDTPGKRYRLPDGREAVALEVGGDGELLCTVNGEPHTVLAADAILTGSPLSS